MSRPKTDKSEQIAAAYAELREAGHPITVRSLRERSGVNTVAASEWLRENRTDEPAPALPEEALRVPLEAFWAVAVAAARKEINAQHATELAQAREAESEALEALDHSEQEAAALKAELQTVEAEKQKLADRAQELETIQAEKETRYEVTVNELRAQVDAARAEEMKAKIDMASAASRLSTLEEALAAIKSETVNESE